MEKTSYKNETVRDTNKYTSEVQAHFPYSDKVNEKIINVGRVKVKSLYAKQ